jgi:nucleoid-associated protein YgaU
MALAAAVLAVLLVGVPWLLTTQVGWPLPRYLPHTWIEWRQWLTDPPLDPERFILNALAAVLWLAWAQFTACVAADAVAAVRRELPRRVRLVVRPVHGAATGLVGAITLTLLARPAAAAPAVQPVTLDTHPGPPAPGADPLRATHPTQSPGRGLPAGLTPGGYWTHPTGSSPTPGLGVTGSPSTADTATSVRTYVVAEDDSLWRIAERQLGDPLRWREIYALNHDRPQPDHGQLSGPYYLIRPGWVLLLPGPPPHTATAAAPHGGPGGGRPERTVVVRPGDSLSQIAATHLGDPGRWRDIFTLNHGRTQADGGRLSDPDRIQPGWTLTLPAPAPRPRPDQPGGAPRHDPAGHSNGRPHGPGTPPPGNPTPSGHATPDPPAASSTGPEHAPHSDAPPAGRAGTPQRQRRISRRHRRYGCPLVAWWG